MFYPPFHQGQHAPDKPLSRKKKSVDRSHNGVLWLDQPRQIRRLSTSIVSAETWHGTNTPKRGEGVGRNKQQIKLAIKTLNNYR